MRFSDRNLDSAEMDIFFSFLLCLRLMALGTESFVFPRRVMSCIGRRCCGWDIRAWNLPSSSGHHLWLIETSKKIIPVPVSQATRFAV